MTTATPVPASRPVPFVADKADLAPARDLLNAWLVDLIALGLNLKQGHWNLRGARFKTVHEQLDEILVDVRAASDDVAERVVTIGGDADGRPRTVADNMNRPDFPSGQLTVDDTIHHCCSNLAEVIQRGRLMQPRLGECDPVSEDLVIGALGKLEKHHWMLQSQQPIA